MTTAPDLMANLRASLERARAAREPIPDTPETSATQADGTTNTAEADQHDATGVDLAGA